MADCGKQIMQTSNNLFFHVKDRKYTKHKTESSVHVSVKISFMKDLQIFGTKWHDKFSSLCFWEDQNSALMRHTSTEPQQDPFWTSFPNGPLASVLLKINTFYAVQNLMPNASIMPVVSCRIQTAVFSRVQGRSVHHLHWIIFVFRRDHQAVFDEA